jgi:phosphoglycerate dehydrogenase-like enzyme
MNVVAYFHLHEVRWNLSDQDRARIEAQHGVQVASVEDEAELPRLLPDADVFVGWHFPRALFASARRLRWVHSASAGVEANLFPEMCASDVILTNSTGLHGISIPEHVLGQMLLLARNSHEAQRLQQRREWGRFQVITFGPTIRELHGSNLAILGAGPIGQNVARLAATFGMHIRVMRRSAAQLPPYVEAVVPPSALLALFEWADWVVCALPLTEETRGLIGVDALRAMRSHAFLINVGRGETIDDDALVDALRKGAIGGAALDAFSQEPLPPEHPFWSLSNLILTPHISGYMPNYFQKALALFEENLDRFVNRRPLHNVVDKRLGYVPASPER